ncbi:serine/threonine protein kinase [Tolypothrix sp. NIES-4075]|uniref:bifunctional serine/threonine-protein kinase/ABC transporter substrate-binding protein n=1 Tax=Tolypothrix sp. NIES-4075 TaxID=2005459 RepID=UPI000B672779|nr:bifunctional serine/threonine-protein kinase/ABC transporter substrate-binding protein [Tolypothrix sp. NIES-4075]GAX40515.1 serine/threonine protein kinase [Tolypothrix sp. NIES-4075]
MDLILKTRYLPLEQIGWGGFGKTFRAWDAHLEQQCVVKQLQPRNTSGNPFSPSELESIERLFEREAKTLRDLRHEQIPQLYDYFELPTPSDSQQELFYLVQEYIQGKTLAQELNTRDKFSEDEVVRDLREILNVLNYIHELRRRVIHRDIKPSNIIRDENGKLYLIDFGAVKRELEPGVPVEQSMAIRTPIFAPPEQLSGGEIFPCSDLYSLAVTCVCLLTGKSANDLWRENRWIWKQHTSLSDHLAGILDRMLSYQPEDRFQSAQDVIAALSGQPLPGSNSISPIIRQPPGRKNPPPEVNSTGTTTREPRTSRFERLTRRVFLPVVLVLVGSAIALFINSLLHPPICDFQNQSGFSCGEQILIPQNPNITDEIFANKEKGTSAFKQGNFNQAIGYFQKYLNSNELDAKNDPEARIYLNNAKAAILKNDPLKIAVTIPIYSLSGTAEQMLRGIAHVQDNINNQQGINKKLLFIEIANYFSEKTKIQEVTNAIVHKDKILGVIGPYRSNDILEAAQYFKNKIVAISPTSNATRGSEFPLGDYVFRTAVDNSILVEKLVKYMLSQKLQKAAILYEPNGEKFVASFIQQFQKILKEKQGQVVKKCPVTKNSTDEALNCLQQAKQQRAEVIVLAFSDKVAQNVAIPIIQHSENLTILGSDTLYQTVGDAIKNKTLQVDKLRIAVPWHRSSGTNVTKCDDIKSNFEKESCNLWGTGDVSWETAASYDATAAMVKGLRDIKGDYNRQNLYEALNNPKFFADGVAAKIEFNDKGDRKPLPGIGVLVKVENNRFVIDEQSQQ